MTDEIPALLNAGMKLDWARRLGPLSVNVQMGPPYLNSATPVARLSNPGMEGADVFTLQEHLKTVGFALCPMANWDPRRLRRANNFNSKKASQPQG
jgi:hypothetical protein